VPSAYLLAADPSIRVLVANLGLACCAMEVESAVRTGLLVDDDDAGVPPIAHTVLVVSGTVTDALVPAVLDAVARTPGHVSVMSFGACASTGGPYWDAPTVTKGIDQMLPVSIYVPGCPPRPEALVAGLLEHLAALSA
jgi:NADH-quinone oxidoreductase subunit B